MLVTLLYAGTTTEKPIVELCNEFEKRLGAFCSFKSHCIKEEKINDTKGVNDAIVSAALSAEASRFSALIPKDCIKIALCIEGKELSSEAFASFIETKRLEGASSFCFIIGSSHGLSEDLKQKCDFKLSFSKMTFPHMLFRLMLTEQIYRAFTIMAGKKYHK